MKTAVQDAMTTEVVAVGQETAFKELAVRDCLSYTDTYPVVAGPVF